MPYDYRADRMNKSDILTSIYETSARRATYETRPRQPAMRRRARLGRRARERETRYGGESRTEFELRTMRSPRIDWSPVATATCALCGKFTIDKGPGTRCRKCVGVWRCIHCGLTKPSSDFPPNASLKGHAARCRECKRGYEAGTVARERRLRSRYTRACKAVGVIPQVEKWTIGELTAAWGDCCFYCGGQWADVDHYIPVAEGGSHSLRNCRPACSNCNNAKRAAMPTEWASSVVLVELRKKNIALPPESLELIRSLAA